MKSCTKWKTTTRGSAALGLFVLVLVVCGCGTEDDPELAASTSPLELNEFVLPRSAWGAKAARKCNPNYPYYYKNYTPKYITIHTTVCCKTADACLWQQSPANIKYWSTQCIRSAQNTHMNKKWCDIGYHFLVGFDGRVFRGVEPETYMGTHVGGHNAGNIGIAFVGNQSLVAPTPKALAAAVTLLQSLRDIHGITLDRTHVKGHTEWPNVSKSCPGKYLLAEIDGLLKGAKLCSEPALKFPVSVSTAGLMPTFMWSSVFCDTVRTPADVYRLQVMVSTNSSPMFPKACDADPAKDPSGQAQCSKQILLNKVIKLNSTPASTVSYGISAFKLPAGATVIWRVRAGLSGKQTGYWSKIAQFKTSYSSAVDAGVPDSPMPDLYKPDLRRPDTGFSCSNKCSSSGATECASGKLRTCVTDINGCLDWTSYLPCPDSFCASGTACGRCQHQCSVLGKDCGGNYVRSCTADANGCRVLLPKYQYCALGCVAGSCLTQLCGNGIVEGTEKCDGTNLNGKKCVSFVGYIGGTLKCSGCSFDKSACTKCSPTTCAAQGKNCGTISDGCTGSLNCGACTLPQTCGGSGTANLCGYTPPDASVPDSSPDAGLPDSSNPDAGTPDSSSPDLAVPQPDACVPNCSGRNCGDNGCGGSCGTCTSPPQSVCQDSATLRTYSVAGSSCPSGVCSYPSSTTTCQYGCQSGACKTCTPATCTGKGYECGTHTDGCSGTLTCGTCTQYPNSYCDTSGKCQCAPSTCSSLGYQCGTASNGCGGSLSCGSCSPTQYGSWSSCQGFTSTCDQTGTQSRSMTTYTCSSGSCSSSTTTQTQSCTRNTNGISCGGTKVCQNGGCTCLASSYWSPTSMSGTATASATTLTAKFRESGTGSIQIQICKGSNFSGNPIRVAFWEWVTQNGQGMLDATISTSSSSQCTSWRTISGTSRSSWSDGQGFGGVVRVVSPYTCYTSWNSNCSNSSSCGICWYWGSVATMRRTCKP